MTIKEQEAVKRIRKEYSAKSDSDLDKLNALVAKIKRPPTIAAYVVGVVAALLLGVGMCVTLGALSWPMPVGIAVGVVGILIAVANVFVYRAVYAARRDKYAAEIIRLSDAALSSDAAVK